MMKLKFLCIIITLFYTIHYSQGQITFDIKAPSRILDDEQFKLIYSIKVEDKSLFTPESKLTKRVQLPDLKDFQIITGPFQSKSTVTKDGIPGEMTTFSYTYKLAPLKEGTFTIPPASVTIDSLTVYKSDSIRIQVVSNKAILERLNTSKKTPTYRNQKIDSVFVRLQASQNTVYENEKVLITFKLFSLHKTIPSVNDYRLPDYNGFIVEGIEPKEPEWILEKYNGLHYYSIIMYQIVVYPQRSGTMTIDPGTFNLQVFVKNKTSRKIFDDFYDDYTTVDKTLVSNPATIYVKSLPPKHPASFLGAVGNYSIISSVDTTNLSAKGNCSFKITISGNGNLKYLPAPRVNLPENIIAQRTKNHMELKADSNGVSGVKSFEYIITPKAIGSFTIPAIDFSFFNPNSRSYKTIKTQPHTIQAEQGKISILQNTMITEDKNIVIILDASSSMLAKDFIPNKIEAAKEGITSFINVVLSDKKTFNSRIGLVSFAGKSQISNELSENQSEIITQLKNINTKTLQDGTATGDGIILSMGILDQKPAKSNVIILITDGANNMGEINPEVSSEIAQLLGYKIYSIGLGKQGETLYPVEADSGTTDISIPENIDEKMLTTIAKKTGGNYFRATNNEELFQILKKIREIEKNPQVINQKRINNHFTNEYARRIIAESYFNSK